MKKIIALLLIAVLIFSTMVVSANDISVYVDGIKLNFDVQSQMINDRTMVPLRAIFEKLGATVMYDDETQTISAYRTGENSEGTIIIIQVNNSKGFVNSKTYELDSPPVVINDRTLVPIRFVGEALGCIVNWDENTQTVNITTVKAPAAAENTNTDKAAQ